ncbi:MAG: flagellin [Tepidisphaerales bacterium]
MSRINTNVVSLIAQRVLGRNQADLNQSLARLSTGLRINTGKDDPAGMIASENLRAEQSGIRAAIENGSRANNIIGTAEGGLNEVSALLTQLQGLVTQTANTGGLSQEEIAANQLQVDSILATINRVAGSTNFQGIQLLNGNYDYLTSGVVTSQIAALRVNQASIPDGASVNVVVNVLQSAQTGVLAYTGGTLGTGGATILISGTKGAQQLSFASGTTISQITAAINAVKAATGLSAQVSGTAVRINSTDYGSKAFVSVTVVSGTFTMSGNKDFGRDAIVQVNGAEATANGKDVSFRSSLLDLEFTIGNSINITNGTSNFLITGGGATFNLGSKVTENNKVSIGIGSMTTANLGNANVGFLNSLGSGGENAMNSGSLVAAQDILNAAIKQVSQLRGRLGAFQKFIVGSTVNNLGVALENASAAESAIRDTDFAAETSALTRSQILTQAATTVLSQANSSPQNVLALLRG